MEHRLLLGGGEQWLPFARSCITKLKKLGLPYADQSFEIDGVSIKVRIEPGHEYIRIEGGDGALRMDSGLVNLWPYSPYQFGEWNRDTYTTKTAVFLPTAQVTAYNSFFTEPSSGPRGWTDEAYKKHVSKTSANQLGGEITVNAGKISGKVPLDDGRSIAFATFKKEDPDTGEWVESKEDSYLDAKKSYAALCPASMFTGKCRVFVQALYGQYLRKNDKSGEDPLVPFSIDDTYRPYIKLNPIKQNDAKTLQPVDVTTSSGIYTNPKNGDYWLINPGETTYFYKLVPSSAGKNLRTLLRSGKITDHTDQTHAEAYILGTCLPDVMNAASHYTPLAAISDFGFGYGWHWNLDGTDAVIVLTQPYSQVVGSPEAKSPTTTQYLGVESKTYKLKVSLAEPDKTTGTTETWSALYTVGGEERWAIPNRTWFVIEPVWGKGVQMVAKIQEGAETQLFTCSATFYAFYKANELQLCTVDITETPDTQTIFECSPRYFDTAYSSVGDPPGYLSITTDCTTVGMEGGYSKKTANTAAYFTANFKCGSEDGVEVYYNRHETEEKREVGGKTITNIPPAPDFSGSTFYAYGMYVYYGALDTENWPVSFGTNLSQAYYPETAHTAPEGTPFVAGYTLGTVETTATYEYTYTLTDISWYSRVVVTSPKYDSEAVIFQTSSQRVENITGGETVTKAGYYQLHQYVSEYWAVAGSGVRWLTLIAEYPADKANKASGDPQVGGNTPLELTEDTQETYRGVLISRATNTDTTPLNLPYELTIGDVGPGEWPQLTSSSYTDTAAICARSLIGTASTTQNTQTKEEMIGVTNDLPPDCSPAFIGWI